MKGLCAVLYRGLRGVGLFPPVIDEMELWQAAVELNEDLGYALRLFVAGEQPAPVPGEPVAPRLLDAD